MSVEQPQDVNKPLYSRRAGCRRGCSDPVFCSGEIVLTPIRVEYVSIRSLARFHSAETGARDEKSGDTGDFPLIEGRVFHLPGSPAFNQRENGLSRIRADAVIKGVAEPLRFSRPK